MFSAGCRLLLLIIIFARPGVQVLMKLIIDIGNTRQKMAAFDRKELAGTDTFMGFDPVRTERFIRERGPFSRCILSTVQKETDQVARFIGAHCEVMVLDHRTRIPLRNRYRSPETLGKDRLAASVGAFSRFPGKNILVIDAGTAITYDVVTAEGEYLGGAISPGIELRFRALNTFTGKLPLVERQENSPLTGRDTQESILSGVMHGTLQEVAGMIREHENMYDDLVVTFTGGDLNYFVSKLKNNIFALPNLVLEGLNEILDING